MSTSTSAAISGPNSTANSVAFPTETEIYILPNGRVIIADLPVELAELVGELGRPQPCAIPSEAAEAQDESPQPQPAP